MRLFLSGRQLAKHGFLVLLLISGLSASAAPHRIDIAIDLDDTLIQGKGKIAPPPGTTGYIEADGGIYHVIHWASEFVAALLQIPNVHVSFFSGGQPQRNTEVLEKLKLPDGRSAWEVKTKLLSYPDLTFPEGAPPVVGRHFGNKDIKKIGEEVSLDFAALVDDHRGYVTPGQERNYVAVVARPNFITDFQRFFLDRADGPEEEVALAVRDTQVELQAANRLVRALGIILTAIDISEAQDTSFADALYSLQWQDGKYSLEKSNRREIYERGLMAMQAVQPTAKIIAINPACSEAIAKIISKPINPWRN